MMASSLPLPDFFSSAADGVASGSSATGAARGGVVSPATGSCGAVSSLGATPSSGVGVGSPGLEEVGGFSSLMPDSLPAVCLFTNPPGVRLLTPDPQVRESLAQL